MAMGATAPNRMLGAMTFGDGAPGCQPESGASVTRPPCRASPGVATEVASLAVTSIAVIGGDGIGPEVVAEGLKVLTAAVEPHGVKVETTDYDLGAARWHRTGETLPDSVLEE